MLTMMGVAAEVGVFGIGILLSVVFWPELVIRFIHFGCITRLVDGRELLDILGR